MSKNEYILRTHRNHFLVRRYVYRYLSIGLPRWHNDAEPACQCRRPGFNPWVKKIPWRRKWQPTPVFLPGKFHEEPGRLYHGVVT